METPYLPGKYNKQLSIDNLPINHSMVQSNILLDDNSEDSTAHILIGTSISKRSRMAASNNNDMDTPSYPSPQILPRKLQKRFNTPDSQLNLKSPMQLESNYHIPNYHCQIFPEDTCQLLNSEPDLNSTEIDNQQQMADVESDNSITGLRANGFVSSTDSELDKSNFHSSNSSKSNTDLNEESNSNKPTVFV